MGVFSRFGRWFVTQVGFQGIVVIAIVWFGFLIVEDSFVRWDLTEDQRFTISEASHQLAAELEDPLTIRVYMSADVPPRYQPLQRQVLDILAEYEAASGGKIKVERYDPDESRTAANEAKNYSVGAVDLPVYEATSVSVLRVYGGIVLVYRDRASEVINFAERYLQGYEGLSVLEYEISSKIWQLSHDKPKLGLTGYLSAQAIGPMGPGRGAPQPQFGGLRRLLGEAFEIENVDLKMEALDPAKVPLLLVVRPKEFSDVETFRLDQYLMKGGRVLMFVTRGEIRSTAWSPNFTWNGFKTGLDEWLAHHGLRVPDELVLHYQNAEAVRMDVEIAQGIHAQMPVPSWFRPIIFAKDSFDRDNPAVQTLKQVSMFWPHPVDLLHDKLAQEVVATTLIRSHEQESWRWKNLNKVDMKLVDQRREGPRREDLRSSPLVVALEGKFNSYFSEQNVPPSLTEEEEGEGEGEEKKTKTPDIVTSSAKPSHLVVVGNSIFISDALLGGQGRGGEVPEYARQATLLAFNLVDWLARSDALIALRAKRYSNRRIVDEDFDSDAKEIQKKAKTDTSMTEEKFRQMIDEARERQQGRRKRWRWINIIVPSFLIVAAGAFVWIFRAARRSGRARVPKPVPPASAGGQEG